MTIPQQAYPYPPQPPQKSWFARHKILTVLGVLIALVAVISVATGGGKDSTGSSTAAADSGEDPAAGIGQPVRDGKFEFVVHSVEPGVTEVGGEYLREQAQGQFVLVKMTVRNIGDEEQSFSMSAQKLLDGDGKEYSVDDGATIKLDAGTVYEQINPGNAVDATIVFDIPAGVVPTELELHDSVFSGGESVVLN